MKVRIEKGLKQNALQDCPGLAQLYVSPIEHDAGDSRVSVRKKVAQAFKEHAERLFGLAPRNKPTATIIPRARSERGTSEGWKASAARRCWVI
jgi:transcriptional regulator with XRE-family HTH domain